MKVILLPPEVLSVAVLILSFVARLSLPTKIDPCHLLHIPVTVRWLKTKTFVTLLLPEILLRHDQIFSFLLESIKSILDHYKGVRKTYKAWIQINPRTNSHSVKCTKGLLHIWKMWKVQNKMHGIVGSPV